MHANTKRETDSNRTNGVCVCMRACLYFYLNICTHLYIKLKNGFIDYFIPDLMTFSTLCTNAKWELYLTLFYKSKLLQDELQIYKLNM